MPLEDVGLQLGIVGQSFGEIDAIKREYSFCLQFVVNQKKIFWGQSLPHFDET
jgi:hypothetical protein